VKVQDISNLFGDYFQGVYVKDDFVVTDGVDDYSIVVFEKEIVEQGFLGLDTQKGPGVDGIYPLILK
jgi:hypothetical protein